MAFSHQTFSVTEVAGLCRVGRSTVLSWIRQRKLKAKRVNGKKFGILAPDLIRFLKASGKPIPSELVEKDLDISTLEPSNPCYETHANTFHGENCQDCIIKREDIFPCIHAGFSKGTLCPETTCLECSYYREIILPRIGFIHLMKRPAAIVQDFFLWAGNKRFAEKTGLTEPELIGIDIEQIVHAVDIEKVLDFLRSLASQKESPEKPIHFKLINGGEISTFVIELNEPRNCWMLLGWR